MATLANVDTAAVEVPEAEGDAKDQKGAAKRRRARETRTLDEMVPKAPPAREEEQEPRRPVVLDPWAGERRDAWSWGTRTRGVQLCADQ